MRVVLIFSSHTDIGSTHKAIFSYNFNKFSESVTGFNHVRLHSSTFEWIGVLYFGSSSELWHFFPLGRSQCVSDSSPRAVRGGLRRRDFRRSCSSLTSPSVLQCTHGSGIWVRWGAGQLGASAPWRTEPDTQFRKRQWLFSAYLLGGVLCFIWQWTA